MLFIVIAYSLNTIQRQKCCAYNSQFDSRFDFVFVVIIICSFKFYMQFADIPFYFDWVRRTLFRMYWWTEVSLDYDYTENFQRDWKEQMKNGTHHCTDNLYGGAKFIA